MQPCRKRLSASLLLVLFGRAAPAAAQEAGAQDSAMAGSVDIGPTGFAVMKPVLASACEHGCPWGELGDFVSAAMQPLGYQVIQCRNCNADKGPPLVSTAGYPPAIGVADIFVGTTTTVNAPVDFGITESGFLGWGYHGLYNYASDGTYFTGMAGPFANLVLIAKIEDPTYLLLAVKTSSGITDLAQIAQQHKAVTILGGGSPISDPVLSYYGLTQSAVSSWGGSIQNPLIAGQAANPQFDVVLNELGSPANNPESAFWTKITQLNDVTFLDLPSSVLETLANDPSLGLTKATAKWGFLRGVDRPIATVARSGEAVFGRDDMPEQAAYDIAKAVDTQRDQLKWYIRPYSYDSRTAWQDWDVPLHPGAKRYYQEMGYMPADAGAPGPKCDAAPNASLSAPKVSGGCAVGVAHFPAHGRAHGRTAAYALWAAGAGLLAFTLRRRRGRRY